MADAHYLSIGEVLGLLLEDFPDVTISKIRFLESQGLIEPERTPSGYRKFYDHDVDLLRAILHEQRENFLPLKVIRDRIESGGIHTDVTAGRTPPRGIRNVETRAATPAAAQPASPAAAEHRDSVFRRTDGGPEWADGRALIPGVPNAAESRAATSPITASVPVTALVPERPASAAPATGTGSSTAPAPAAAPSPVGPPPTQPRPAAPAPTIAARAADASAAPAAPTAAMTEPTRTEATRAPSAPIKRARVEPTAGQRSARPAGPQSAMPYTREELCAAAQISTEQLEELESYGLLIPKGTGDDASYPPDLLEIAALAGRFLANGIDARHLRSWRQNADREAALFEQRIMPLLRQRNPASRQLALDTLTELADLGVRLHNALIDSALRHHLEGG